MQYSLLLAGLLSCAVLAHGAETTPPRFELPASSVLIDEQVSIVVSGLRPGASVTVRLQRDEGSGRGTGSSATFVADESGRIDVTRMAPISGSYKGVDAMGLFWSSEAAARNPIQERWQLAAEVAGIVVASGTLQRHTVAPDVRVT